VACARDILESEGQAAVTMRRIAQRLGIRAPSLYKHFASKRDLEMALVEQGLDEVGVALHRAVDAAPSRQGLRELLRTYRAEALSHPNLYRLATVGPLARDELTPGLEDWAGAPFLTVTGDPHVAQALWSFAHGMVVLELDGRFPESSDLDRTWAAGAKAFAGPQPR